MLESHKKRSRPCITHSSKKNTHEVNPRFNSSNESRLLLRWRHCLLVKYKKIFFLSHLFFCVFLFWRKYLQCTCENWMGRRRMRIVNESVENLLGYKNVSCCIKKVKQRRRKKEVALPLNVTLNLVFFGYTLFIIILDIYFILLPHTYRLTDLSCSKEGKKLNAENSRRRRWSFSQLKYFFSFYLLILFRASNTPMMMINIFSFFFFTLVWWKYTRSRFFREKHCLIVRKSLAYFSNDREDDNNDFSSSSSSIKYFYVWFKSQNGNC